jgi:hypothetical protein
MRLAVPALVLTLASPAAAQDLSAADRAFDMGRQAELAMQQQMLRQREIALSNELATLEARVRTEQALRDLEVLRVPPALPPVSPKAPPAALDSSRLASIPDDRLAASNARVLQAARDRR